MICMYISIGPYFSVYPIPKIQITTLKSWLVFDLFIFRRHQMYFTVYNTYICMIIIYIYIHIFLNVGSGTFSVIQINLFGSK